jgi:recombinational DNA repair ATPase RecF
MAPISHLDVRDFRGIPNQAASLIFDRKSALLLGQKGTGNSSFVDTIKTLLRGRVSTLDGPGWPTHST